MNTTEKLTLIRARCTELLALAEKRTPGVWSEDAEQWRLMGLERTRQYGHDTGFACACAGNAEAGWRATIAAIDGLQGISRYESDGRICLDESPNGSAARVALANILNAWPDELLNPTNQ